jgi:hypothetical protein
MKPRSDGQLNLPPAPLANRTQPDAVRPNHTRDAWDPTQAHAVAAELFDEALTAAKLTSQEAAYLLSVSESLVRRMRSPNARERVSFTQMLRLPPAFHVELHRAMNRRFGFGRQALARLLDAVGDLALVLER